MQTPMVCALKEGVYHSRLEHVGNMPVATFLPQAYEPRYPYPLLVFLHGHGERETQWLEAFPAISRRNHICIGLRGPHLVQRRDGQVGYGWGRGRRCDGMIEDYVLTAIRETMRFSNIHSERIFLVGCCEGATIAYQMGLSFPDKFAGVVALNGWLPTGPLPLAWPKQANGERGLMPKVFIGHGTFNIPVPVRKAEEAFRVLYSTGHKVTRRFYPTDHQLSAVMMRDVDRWVIAHCDSFAE